MPPRVGILALAIPLGGCAKDAVDVAGLSALALAGLIAAHIVLYPIFKARLEARDHRHRMSRRWREAWAQGLKRPPRKSRRSKPRSQG